MIYRMKYKLPKKSDVKKSIRSLASDIKSNPDPERMRAEGKAYPPALKALIEGDSCSSSGRGAPSVDDGSTMDLSEQPSTENTKLVAAKKKAPRNTPNAIRKASRYYLLITRIIFVYIYIYTYIGNCSDSMFLAKE